MLEAIEKYSWKVITGVALLGGIGGIYKLKQRSLPHPELFPPLIPENPAKFKSVKEELEARSKKEKMYKLFACRLNQKVAENVNFVEAQISQIIILEKLNADVNNLPTFDTAENLSKAVGYAIASLFLQRFVYLAVILQMALHNKKVMLRETKEEVKGEEIDSRKENASILLEPMTAFIRDITEEIASLVSKHVKKVSLLFNEAQELLESVYQEVERKYCSFEPKEEFIRDKDISLYNLGIVNNFIARLGNPDTFIETKVWMESLYFQSLLMEGVDIDFKILCTEYNKLLQVVYQGKHLKDSINNRDIVFSLLKAQKEYIGKCASRYKSDINADSDIELTSKMMKMLSMDNNKDLEETKTSKVYKQSLNDFLNLVLFEEKPTKDPLADLSSVFDTNFMESQLLGANIQRRKEVNSGSHGQSLGKNKRFCEDYYQVAKLEKEKEFLQKYEEVVKNYGKRIPDFLQKMSKLQQKIGDLDNNLESAEEQLGSTMRKLECIKKNYNNKIMAITAKMKVSIEDYKKVIDLQKNENEKMIKEKTQRLEEEKKLVEVKKESEEEQIHKDYTQIAIQSSKEEGEELEKKKPNEGILASITERLTNIPKSVKFAVKRGYSYNDAMEAFEKMGDNPNSMMNYLITRK